MSKIDWTLFKKNLATVRKAKGFGTQELAIRAGVTPVTERITDLEYEGCGTPTLHELIDICRSLNVSVDDMLYKQVVVKIEFKSIDHLL